MVFPINKILIFLKFVSNYLSNFRLIKYFINELNTDLKINL